VNECNGCGLDGEDECNECCIYREETRSGWESGRERLLTALREVMAGLL
jgi:hypothetical protein